MSKKRRNRIYEGGVKTVKPIMDITKALDRYGKLKGKNKKETKILRAACVHHRYNRKMTKVKATAKNMGNALVCTACKQEIAKQFFSKEQVKDVCRELREITEQAKYLSVACNTSPETINYFSKFSVELRMFPKAYMRLAEIANNRGKVKKKKKDYSGSRQYGSWK